eukprot:TRINITY_DN2975_c0_g1_i3.p1 TRINITY_DN2975_c0_g1~~TRINITY_DN2975_c0_g1_i3.p1  ORF type:complete len:237 (-),score=7.21 TRINITY_DN2975_c0_g1_i3:43-732(-)
MGTIYWQLNDIWQGASWASLEYSGNWKMLHYYAKNFYSQVIGSSFVLNNEFYTYVVSDSLTNFTGTLSVSLWAYDKGLLHTWNTSVSLPQLHAQHIFSSPLNTMLSTAGCAGPTSCFAVSDLYDARGHLLHENFLYLSPLQNVTTWQDPKLQITAVDEIKGQINQYLITVSSSAIAAFVWVESSYTGRFSDNGFLMLHETKQLIFYSHGKLTPQALKASLAIRSLFDVE